MKWAPDSATTRVSTTVVLGLFLTACDTAASPVAPWIPTDRPNPAVALEVIAGMDALTIGSELALEARYLDARGNAVTGGEVHWSSSDTLVATVTSAGAVLGRSYGSVQIRAHGEALSAVTHLKVVPGARYASIDLDYFREVALGAEYGGAGTRLVRRWESDVRVQVHGDPTAEDLRVLGAVVDDLNELMESVRVRLVDDDGNVDLFFAPESSFADLDPNYTSTNYGFFWVWWNAQYSIQRARVLISTTDITQEARSHLIREELTQSLGLMNDSWSYPESICYQGWTETADYAVIDRLVVEMLYRREVRPAMTEDEALELLSSLPRTLGMVAGSS